VAVGGPAAQLLVSSGTSSVTAGMTFAVTVRAEDSVGNTAGGYLGTVHLSSTDGSSGLPSDYMFTAADQGVHTFLVFLQKAGGQSVTVADRGNGTLTGTAAVTVQAGAFAQYGVSAPLVVPAGSSFTVTLTAEDAFSNLVSAYQGTAHFTSTDGAASLPGDYPFQASDQGVHTFAGVMLTTAGLEHVTANDTSATSLTGTALVRVNAVAASRLQVTAAPTSVAGSPLSVTVTAQDPFGNVATSFAGVVQVTSSDVAASLPGLYTFVAGDQGVHTFAGVVLRSSLTQTVTAQDSGDGLTAGTASVSVSGVAVTHFGVSLAAGTPAVVPAGTVLSVSVTALDSFNNVVAGYRGTVRLSTTDAAGVLPADYTFQALDGGVHTFGVTLRTAGSQSVRATDLAAGVVQGAVGIGIAAKSASQLLVQAGASSTAAGGVVMVTVKAEDAFGNQAADYRGTVHLGSTDGQAVLPGNYTFTASDAGVHTFAVTLKSAGSQAVSVMDTLSAFLAGQASVAVSALAASALALAAPAVSHTGTPFAVTVTARDVFGNVATGYRGTVVFGSTDGLAQLPGNTTFVAADNGVHTFMVALGTPGQDQVTVHDLAQPALLGTALVRDSTTTHFQVQAAASSKAGTALAVTVTALDQANQVDGTYTGLVQVSSTDGLASLPGDFAFTAAEHGVHSFTVVLRGSGSQTVGVTEVGNSSVAGAAQVLSFAGLAVTGADAGGGPEVKVVDAQTGTAKLDFLAYDAHFTGGVRVALGDVTGDGAPDVITAPGTGGGPDVRVFDGLTGRLKAEFMAYAVQFTGGVQVAAADFNHDGFADVVTAADAGGGPHVEVFDGQALVHGQVVRLASFFAYAPGFLGGVRLAVGDVTGDGVPDLITAPGPGGGPDVRVFDGARLQTASPTSDLAREFMAYDAQFTGGVYVAAGDANGDGFADIFTGAGAGGGPHTKVFSGKDGTVLASFMAYAASVTSGVRVAAADINGDGKAELITATGSNQQQVVVRDALTAQTLDSFFAYNTLFAGGVFVGAR
jgi:hypothetical protein